MSDLVKEYFRILRTLGPGDVLLKRIECAEAEQQGKAMSAPTDSRCATCGMPTTWCRGDDE